MKNKLIAATVVAVIVMAGWGVLKFRAERARHALEAALKSSQVVAAQAERDRITAEYVETERLMQYQIDTATAKAASLKRDLDSRPPVMTQAQLERLRADASKTWETKFNLLQVDYSNAIERLDLANALVLTLQGQCTSQQFLIDTQAEHIVDLNKLIGTTQAEMTKAIAEKYILQDQLSSSRTWGAVKTVGLAGMVVWALVTVFK